MICAGIVFMLVFSHGVELMPAVVSDVADGMPAAEAGLRGGDTVLAIDGDDTISFMDLTIAGAFADIGEKVPLRVRHVDGTVETISVEPQWPGGTSDAKGGTRKFGGCCPRPKCLHWPIVQHHHGSVEA